jgi:hypothetical protein
MLTSSLGQVVRPISGTLTRGEDCRLLLQAVSRRAAKVNMPRGTHALIAVELANHTQSLLSAPLPSPGMSQASGDSTGSLIASRGRGAK